MNFPRGGSGGGLVEGLAGSSKAPTWSTQPLRDDPTIAHRPSRGRVDQPLSLLQCGVLGSSPQR